MRYTASQLKYPEILLDHSLDHGDENEPLEVEGSRYYTTTREVGGSRSTMNQSSAGESG